MFCTGEPLTQFPSPSQNVYLLEQSKISWDRKIRIIVRKYSSCWIDLIPVPTPKQTHTHTKQTNTNAPRISLWESCESSQRWQIPLWLSGCVMIVGVSQVFHVAVNVADTDLRQNNCRASAGVISRSFLPEESTFCGVMWPGRGLQPKFTHPPCRNGKQVRITTRSRQWNLLSRQVSSTCTCTSQ